MCRVAKSIFFARGSSLSATIGILHVYKELKLVTYAGTNMMKETWRRRNYNWIHLSNASFVTKKEKMCTDKVANVSDDKEHSNGYFNKQYLFVFLQTHMKLN